MEDKEILFYFEQAQKDWSRPKWMCYLFGGNHTEHGLCSYFILKHGLLSGEVVQLQNQWRRHSVKIGFYDFNNREERVQAIKKVIADLKKRIK